MCPARLFPACDDLLFAQNKPRNRVTHRHQHDHDRRDPQLVLSQKRQRLRADGVTETDRHELYQRNAPQVEAALYLVPRVIE